MPLNALCFLYWPQSISLRGGEGPVNTAHWISRLTMALGTSNGPLDINLRLIKGISHLGVYIVYSSSGCPSPSHQSTVQGVLSLAVGQRAQS